MSGWDQNFSSQYVNMHPFLSAYQIRIRMWDVDLNSISLDSWHPSSNGTLKPMPLARVIE